MQVAILNSDGLAERYTSLAEDLRLTEVTKCVESLAELPPDGDWDLIVAQAEPARLLAATSLTKHLLVEGAEVNDNLADWSRLDQACRDNGGSLLFSRPLRFHPGVQSLRESLRAGQLGQLGLLRLHYWLRVQRRQAATDLLDLVRWLVDSPPRHVYSRRADINQQSDYGQFHLGFEGGAMAIADTCVAESGGDYFSLSLIGSNGAAHADDHHSTQLMFSGGAPRAITCSPDLGLAAQLDAIASRLIAESETQVQFQLASGSARASIAQLPDQADLAGMLQLADASAAANQVATSTG